MSDLDKLYVGRPRPVVTGQWDGHDPDSFEANEGELAGGLFWISLVDPTNIAFTWDPVAIEPVKGLTELARICTKHTWAYYGMFKPTVEEVWNQIPKDSILRTVVAFETLKNDVRLSGDHHLATTILYGIDLKSGFEFGFPAVSTRVAKPKKKKPTIKEQIDNDPRFKTTKYLVEATSFEKMSLWRDWHYLPNIRKLPFMGEERASRSPVKTWEQDYTGPGWLETVGQLDGRPVCVNVNWDIINGELVCFYDSTSQVVDHEVIEEWLKGTFKAKKYKTDAMNFHNIMLEINGHY